MGLVAGAGSTALLDAFGGGTGQVVRVGSGAVSVALPGPRLLVLDLHPGPASLPCAVLAPALATVVAAGAVVVGDEVMINSFGLQLPSCWVQVSRWWSPARVLPREPGPASPRPADPGGLDAVTWRALRAAVSALAEHDAPATADLLCGVLGRGPGSTPAADDAVAGLLLAAQARPGPGAAVLDQVGRAVTAAAAARTTPLSAELLRHAAGGLATRVVVRALHRPTEGNRAAVRALGASSGAATLAGADLVASVRWGRLAA
ncbi:oxamate carbamoyltransferase subunit AllH family protein [Angustibacter luteus]|uniref:DUF2877 domain-containing protein n=1 Tax=Angustibacter luteus TaxID=658456 RepID=A0ABW1JA91_9ACTN